MSHTGTSTHTQIPVHYRTARINGLDVFYREAGPPDAPVLLLLHGFPTSSNMFRNLIPRLAGSFHVVAPGLSRLRPEQHAGSRERFAYTFENLTQRRRGARRAARARQVLAVRDGLRCARSATGSPCGIPSGCRRSIVQNGNAYEEGLREFWDPIKKYWADPRPENRSALHVLVEPKSTRVAVRERRAPTGRCWTRRPGWSTRSAWIGPATARSRWTCSTTTGRTCRCTREFQAFFRKHQPPTLIVWGKNDVIFPPEGAAPYARDLKNVETHLLDTGHFALETHGEEIAAHIETFLLTARAQPLTHDTPPPAESRRRVSCTEQPPDIQDSEENR